MHRSILAIFFSFVFIAMTATPTLVTLLDTDYDVSFLLDTNEEEEKEGKDSQKDIEINVLQIVEHDTKDIFSRSSLVLRFYSNTYSSTHSELSSPPPEYTSNC